MSVEDAISRAEEILPGVPAPEGQEDPRWQVIIAVAEYIPSNPEEIWHFAARWGESEDSDLRMAVATCVLEHLLEHHFDLIFPRVEALAERNSRFADTFCSCWEFGQAERPDNARRLEALRNRLADSAPREDAPPLWRQEVSAKFIRVAWRGSAAPPVPIYSGDPPEPIRCTWLAICHYPDRRTGPETFAVYFLDEDGHPQEVLQYDHLQAALDQGASLGGFAAQQWLPCAVEVCDDVEVLVPSSFPKDDESDESTIPQFEGVKRPTMPGLAIIAVSWLVFLIVGPVVVQLLAPAGTSAGAKAVWRVLIGLCVLVVHPPMIWSATRGRAEGPRRGQRIAAFISAGFMIPGLMLLTLD